jgi:DNA polymerase-3 subunit epsilon
MTGCRLWSSWRGTPPAADIDEARWVVADVESSGLDPARDRLLAIAAVAVHFDDAARPGGAGRLPRPRIVLGDSLELRLRQPEAALDRPDKVNILVHGIGVGAQRSGTEPGEALAAWARFIGRSPLVGFHSDFDRRLIDSAGRRQGGSRSTHPWLDLEPLAAVLHDDPRHHPLDHWLQQQGIACLARHQAAADALATAELLLTLWPAVRRRCDGRFRSVEDLARGHRFLAGRG